MLYPDWSFYRTRARWVAVSKHARACTQTYTQREVDNHWQKKQKNKTEMSADCISSQDWGLEFGDSVFLSVTPSVTSSWRMCLLKYTFKDWWIAWCYTAIQSSLLVSSASFETCPTHTQHKLSLSLSLCRDSCQTSMTSRNPFWTADPLSFCCCLWRFILFVDTFFTQVKQLMYRLFCWLMCSLFGVSLFPLFFFFILKWIKSAIWKMNVSTKERIIF